MAIISVLVQLASVVAGIYLMFDSSFVKGVLLMATVAVLHFAASGISHAILALLQRRMTDREKEHLAHMASLGLQNEAAPRSWHIATNTVVLVFVALASASIYLFLTY